jgi:oligopeptide transport system substrate-binding protein
LRRLAAPLLVVGLLAGCSGGGEDAAAQRTDREPARLGEPVRGGVLTIGLDRPRSLDPADASPSNRSELIAADLLFDGLTTHDNKTGALTTALASKYVHDAKLTRWTFRLRPDAKFANGRRITAADVKYSIERVASKGSRSPAAAQLELVQGYHLFVEGQAQTVTGIVASEPDLVTVALTTPLATLPDLLASPVFGVVPKEAVEAQSPSFDQAPIGSGPFRLRGREGNVVHLSRAEGAQTFLEGIDLVFYDDAEDAYDAFADGDLDWSRVPSTRIDEAAERFGTAGFRPFHAEVFYGFNLKDPRFADIRFRRAIVRAIDRQAIVRAIYTDTVDLLNGVVVKGVSGALEDACAGQCDYDPRKARALLQQAFGLRPMPTIGIDYDEGTVQEAIARAMAADLLEVGIKTQLRPLPFSEYQEFAASGNQQLFRLGWIGAYRSADAFLSPLFLSGAPDNVMGFFNPTVNHYLKTARAEPDPARRERLYQGAEKLIMGRMPLVPIAQFETHTVAAARVHDLEVAVDGTFDATRVWVTPA